MARASAASAEDLQRWKALGGTWEDLPAKKGAKAAADKLFIAPSGKESIIMAQLEKWTGN